MTPQEKAKELVEKFEYVEHIEHDDRGNKDRNIIGEDSAKDCALIAVDEIVSYIGDSEYWQKVKAEIEKL